MRSFSLWHDEFLFDYEQIEVRNRGFIFHLRTATIEKTLVTVDYVVQIKWESGIQLPKTHFFAVG